MRNRTKGAILVRFVILAILVLTLTGEKVSAQAYPETVRVGINSGKTAVASVALQSNGGHDIGYYSNNQFVVLLNEAAGQQTIIRKDSYYVRSVQGVTTEYNPTEGVPSEGELSGPYHIQVGAARQDYASAKTVADIVVNSGIAAYPVFDNGWYVWTGFYSDSAKAEAAIPNLTTQLGTADLTVVNPSSSRIIIYNASFQPKLIYSNPSSPLTAKPNGTANPAVFSVNGKGYRGEMEFRRFTDSDMTVINILNLEQYLYGVVPSEIGASSPAEALKAQAVAARTYTYSSINRYSKWSFDVTNTVDSQVYGGYDVEQASSNAAVDQTKGIKVLYNGSLASLFYYSSSGGMTEDNINVWGTPLPYLTSVVDPYEAGTSYNYTWQRVYTAEDIRKKLLSSNVDLGEIISMTAEEYTAAGRVNKLKFVGTTGSITYNREDIRRILADANGTYLPSRMFTITTSGSGGQATAGSTSVATSEGILSGIALDGKKVLSSGGSSVLSSGSGNLSAIGSNNTKGSIGGGVPAGSYLLSGKGWGHGVGMSQEGAKGLARNGYTYDQILKHYFTGVTIE